MIAGLLQQGEHNQSIVMPLRDAIQHSEHGILYRIVGFDVEGRRRRAVLVDGVYYDDILMALLFDAAP